MECMATIVDPSVDDFNLIYIPCTSPSLPIQEPMPTLKPSYSLKQLYTVEDARTLFDQINKDVVYEMNSKVKVRGKFYDIPRKHIAYGDDGVTYSFSGLMLLAKPWLPILLKIKADVERDFLEPGQLFNFVLINRYENGYSYIGSHKDDEREIDHSIPIVTLSLETVRNFVLTPDKKSEEKMTLALENGSALSLNRFTNMNWRHGIPKAPSVKDARVSLSFRRIQTMVPERPTTTVDIVSPPVESPCIPAGYFDIGQYILFGASLFKDVVRVHLRHFVAVDGQLVPTKRGLVFSPYYFQKLYDSLEKFEYKLPSNCLTVENAVMFSTTVVDGVHVQNMILNSNSIYQLSAAHMILTIDQFENFKSYCGKVRLSVRHLLFSVLLSKHVLELAPTEELLNFDENLYGKLVYCFNDMLTIC